MVLGKPTCATLALRGVDLLVRRKTGVPLVTLGLYVPRLEFEPAERAGLAALMIRSAVRGAGDLDAAGLAFAFERLGGTLSPTAASDWLGFGATVLTEHLAEAAALLDQVCTVPRFGEADINTERDLMKIEAEQVANDMFRYPFPLGFAGAFRDRTYGLPVSGLPETLAGISAAEVRDWHTRAMLGVRPVVLAVGDIDPEEASATLAGISRSIARGTRQGRLSGWGDQPRARCEWSLGRRRRPHWLWSFPGPLRSGSQRHAADVWAAVASGLGDACSRPCVTGALSRIPCLRRAGSGGEPELWSLISRRRRSGRKRRGRRCCRSWRGFEPLRSRRWS